MTIEEKEQAINNRVKEKLDENNIQYTIYMGTSYDPDGLLEDGTSKELFHTTILTPPFNNIVYIYSDIETLEPIFIQTGPVRFMTFEDYFQKRD